MSCNKEHKEFYQVDFTTGWQRPDGYPPGIQLKVLAGKIDLKKKAGGYTRLLRFMPGAFTSEPFVHDHWEEVLRPPGRSHRELETRWHGRRDLPAGHLLLPAAGRPARTVPHRDRLPPAGDALLRSDVIGNAQARAQHAARAAPASP